MLYTLADARRELGRFVDGGSCKTATIDSAINAAVERLMDGEDWECLRKVIRIGVCNRSFPLPYNVEKIMGATVDGTPANIYGTYVQFLSSGPGDFDLSNRGGSLFRDLADKGDHWPIMFDIPTYYKIVVDNVETDVYPDGLQLFAVGSEKADKDLTLLVRGHLRNGEEVNPAADSGEYLPIHQWTGGVEGQLSGHWDSQLKLSTNYFKDITAVIKPASTGYISLYAVDPVNHRFFFLAKYHPAQTLPTFRRYNVTNKNVGDMANILAHVKLRHVTLVDANDILPVDSLQAIKLMVMALSQENAGNLQPALMFEAQAKRVMGDREKARTMKDATPVIMNSDYRTSLGRSTLGGGMLL